MIGQFVLGVGRSRMESRLGEAAKRGREAVGNYRSVARSETASETPTSTMVVLTPPEAPFRPLRFRYLTMTVSRPSSLCRCLTI